MPALPPEKLDKFMLLYETYGKIIYCTIKKFKFDEYTAEDLSQDIYMVIVRHLDDIDMDDYRRTRNYIITITRNCCISHQHRLSKRMEDPSEDMSALPLESEDVLSQLIHKEQAHRLADEIGRLDDIYRSVLELKYINGFQNKEIAEILRIPKKTVEMRLYRAKKILKKKMKSWHIDQPAVRGGVAEHER